ncbi:MAG TPA: type IV toxin-antitoxin system AbiEi family antitoxin domain-containing protein [Pseudonocardiaceae bacterium]|nr:type IV toxin-antitoxin system AbiEi family antitoxin domain-containing protein [Pseudonocardiaceae bacterium]
MPRRVEVTLAELTAGQWGLCTAPQAQDAGISRMQLTRLTQAGVLQRLAHGVYALHGAGTDDRLELRAAWLGLDPARTANDRLGDGPAGTVVSHSSAADLYGFGDLDADHHEFTVPKRQQTRRRDIRLHRGVLPDNDVTVLNGLPVTKPERTVVDLLKAGHDGEHVAGVLADAVRTRSIDVGQLGARLAPFAARFDFAVNDGQGLLDHLLELGGAADQVLADDLVQLARAGNSSLAEWAALGNQLAGRISTPTFTSGPPEHEEPAREPGNR